METILENLRKEMTNYCFVKCLVVYFIAKAGQEITTTELRELGLVNNNKFKSILESLIIDIDICLYDRGYTLTKKSTKYGGLSYICKKRES